MLVVGLGGEAGASGPSPVQVTCTNLKRNSAGLTLSGCNDDGDTGGGGMMGISEAVKGSVTITVTWNSGLTTVEANPAGHVLGGAGPLLARRRRVEQTFYSASKFEGTVTRGTASDLIGGAAKVTTCEFSKTFKVRVEEQAEYRCDLLSDCPPRLQGHRAESGQKASSCPCPRCRRIPLKIDQPPPERFVRVDPAGGCNPSVWRSTCL